MAGIGENIPKAKLSTLYKNIGWFEDIRLMETDTVGHDLTGRELRLAVATAEGAAPVLQLSSAGNNPTLVIRDQAVPENHGWFDIQVIESAFATIPPGDYVFDLIVITGVVREGWLRGEIEISAGVTPSP
jgi:hypothetical protein